MTRGHGIAGHADGLAGGLLSAGRPRSQQRRRPPPGPTPPLRPRPSPHRRAHSRRCAVLPCSSGLHWSSPQSFCAVYPAGAQQPCAAFPGCRPAGKNARKYLGGGSTPESPPPAQILAACCTPRELSRCLSESLTPGVYVTAPDTCVLSCSGHLQESRSCLVRSCRHNLVAPRQVELVIS